MLLMENEEPEAHRLDKISYKRTLPRGGADPVQEKLLISNAILSNVPTQSVTQH
jgi:hypothetical protein